MCRHSRPDTPDDPSSVAEQQDSGRGASPVEVARSCPDRLRADRDQSMAFMMVPALVATAPPIIAPAIIFGDSSPPPVHFSQANLPPA
ncbi:Uncharacterised protein [Nocardia asteroides]|nr:hypothetical protein SAMN05444423_104456 [Nocardia asteroides]VEG34219.1 Uncharacterised protein [Nocardia asteroides]